MIFWIFVGLFVMAVVLSVLYQRDNHWFEWDEFWGSVGASFLALGVLGLLFCGIGVAGQTRGGGELEQQATYGLKALQNESQTSSSADGVFFLVFGYYSSDEETTKSVNYIQVAEDGGATLQSVDTKDAVIYEDGATSPRVEEWSYVGESDGFWVPWHYEWVSPLKEYRFHIPAGAIIEGYEVSL